MSRLEFKKQNTTTGVTGVEWGVGGHFPRMEEVTQPQGKV